MLTYLHDYGLCTPFRALSHDRDYEIDLLGTYRYNTYCKKRKNSSFSFSQFRYYVSTSSKYPNALRIDYKTLNITSRNSSFINIVFELILSVPLFSNFWPKQSISEFPNIHPSRGNGDVDTSKKECKMNLKSNGSTLIKIYVISANSVGSSDGENRFIIVKNYRASNSRRLNFKMGEQKWRKYWNLVDYF